MVCVDGEGWILHRKAELLDGKEYCEKVTLKALYFLPAVESLWEKKAIGHQFSVKNCSS